MMRLAFFTRILPILFDEAAVVPPVVPPEVNLGAYATDGRHGSKVRSRYFRPDAAYRYRRGRR
jgi:hypothetical protein